MSEEARPEGAEPETESAQGPRSAAVLVLATMGLAVAVVGAVVGVAAGIVRSMIRHRERAGS